MWADEAALEMATRRLDEWETSFADRAQRARSLTDRLAALTGSASSPDRLVEVTVDSSNRLVDLRLHEQTRQHPAARTAQQILAATQAAYADLLRQVTDATRDTLGDDPAGAAIIESYRQRTEPDPGGAGAAG